MGRICFISNLRGRFSIEKRLAKASYGYGQHLEKVVILVLKSSNLVSQSLQHYQAQNGNWIEVPEYLGRNFNLGLDLRAKARYKPHAQLEPRDAEFIINLAQELLQIAKKELS